MSPSLTRQPDGWLAVEFEHGIPAGRWISLRFRSSFFDDLVRPVVSFRTPRRNIQTVLPAALLGTATWIGYVPKGTTEVLIDPGKFAQEGGFEIEACSVISWSGVLGRLAWRGRHWSYLSLWVWLAGFRHYAQAMMSQLLADTPLARYHEWRMRGIREVDLGGIDRRRMDWRSGPHIRVVMPAPTPATEPQARLAIESLQRQVYPNWSVVFVTPPGGTPQEEPADELSRSERAAHVSGSERVADLWPEDRHWDRHRDRLSAVIAPLTLGDTLPSYALAVVAEYAAAHADTSVFYGDEESIDRHGRYCDPELKPDWSPIFQRASSYMGRAVFYRAMALSRDPSIVLSDLLESTGNSKLSALLSAGSVGHLRRITLTKPKPQFPNGGGVAVADGRECIDQERVEIQTCISEETAPVASIIIPTKDRSRLLADCLASLSTTRPSNFEVIIVDNGSKERRTRALYASLKRDDRIRFIDSPGPFNFSHLCNQGAAQARAPVLVFLNNDTVALSANWLAELVKWANQPDVGAVGAKLLYPSHRLQHGGVVLGLLDDVGLREARATPGYPGYLRRLVYPHEVSAVTGACLAVAKIKFDAVGGFDADKFPVDLNDIDLCLRLAASQWKTVFAADAVLVHHESATRGWTRNIDLTYKHERAHFRSLWQSRFQDDPYFHPALSLNFHRTMLAGTDWVG